MFLLRDIPYSGSASWEKRKALELNLGCIHYVSYRGGQRILGGDLKFLEQKKGGYENCLNISGGMLIFCKILSSFCNGFKR